MSDLILYLDAEVGICVEDMIISHLLWADDLVLLVNGVAGLKNNWTAYFDLLPIIML